jgi:hypothetical protein
MSRRRVVMRDVALGYASRDIPILPLHYPLPHRGDLQPAGGRTMAPSAASGGCSCRDPGCGQVGKHPLGSLVPHGSRTPPPTGPGSWPGGPATPKPTSAWPPATASMSWTSTAPPAPRPSGRWRPSMAWRARGRWFAPWGWLALPPGPHWPGQRLPSRAGVCGLAGAGRLCGRPTQPPCLRPPLPVGSWPRPRHPTRSGAGGAARAAPAPPTPAANRAGPASSRRARPR